MTFTLEGLKPRDIKKTVVAFANTVPKNKTAVLFIGIKDDGSFVGVENTDSLQKKITEALGDCYPKIPYQIEVLEKEGMHVVVVETFYSKERPHFSGPAYIRAGSQSIVASEEKYKELIATRNSKVYEILKWKNKIVTVRTDGKKLGSPFKVANPGAKHRQEYECSVEDCDSHAVTLKDIVRSKYCSESLEGITLLTDQRKLGRLMLICKS